MVSIHFPIYILLLFLITAVIMSLTSKKFDNKIKAIIFFIMLISLLLSIFSLANIIEKGSHVYNFGNWSQNIGIQFIVDEFSAIMALTIILVSKLIIVYSLNSIEQEITYSQLSSYYTLVFLLLFSMLGITYTNDLFNMYVFMEILSLTSCGIISIKRKKENYLAAFRYLILNTIGSLSILMGIALLYMVTGHLNITEVGNTISEVWQYYPRNLLVSLGFMLTGLAIKAALFPLHIWLPDAHSNAPTPSSALLSGLVVKVYIFSGAKILFKVIGQEIIISLGVATIISYFAALGMIMGSIFAIGQKDIKRMLAYSSVAQIGYIAFGVGLATIQGLAAALFHVIAHALMKSALFLSAGAIIKKTSKRDVKDFNGIGYEMPISMTVFSIAALGMIGIPGINGFMSKIYLSFAAIDSGQPYYLIVILASSFLNSIYYLPIIISAFLKEGEEGKKSMILDKTPKTMLFPLIIFGILIIFMGLFPQTVMNVIEKAAYIFLKV